MNSTASTLKDRADRVAAFGRTILAKHPLDDLKSIWCRLPKVGGPPPVGQRALADRIALYLLDLGFEADTADLALYIREKDPVREFEPTTNSEAQATEILDKKTSVTTSVTDEDPTMTSTATTPAATGNGAAGALKASKKRPTRAAKAASATGKPAGSPAGSGSAASSTSSARKASGKGSAKAPKAAAKKTPGARRSTGPRAGSMTELVVKMTADGKDSKAIGAAIAKAFPKSVFAEEVKDGEFRSVAYYQRAARQRGWLKK